jgi:chromosomal replication initiation ATPase DnaA
MVRMSADEAWACVLEQLERDMNRGPYLAYVRDVRLVSYQAGLFTLGCRNEFACAWMTDRMTNTLRRLLSGAMNRAVEVKFTAGL